MLFSVCSQRTTFVRRQASITSVQVLSWTVRIPTLPAKAVMLAAHLAQPIPPVPAVTPRAAWYAHHPSQQTMLLRMVSVRTATSLRAGRLLRLWTTHPLPAAALAATTVYKPLAKHSLTFHPVTNATIATASLHGNPLYLTTWASSEIVSHVTMA